MRSWATSPPAGSPDGRVRVRLPSLTSPAWACRTPRSRRPSWRCWDSEPASEGAAPPRRPPGVRCPGTPAAAAETVMGTVLFTSIQLLVALRLDAEDWRITVPIYAAYGTIAISVGWLSQQLHEFYGRAIEGERVAVIRQLAVTMRHEVNNALAAILAEGQLLEHDAVLTHPEDKQSLQNILTMARRIQHSIDTLVNVTHAPVTEYVEGMPMIDLRNVKSAHQRSKD